MAATDATLVLGVLNGDRAAFTELYDRRVRLIRAICYDATGDLHVAADLTQEVFLRAYRKLGDLSNPQKFAAWLVAVAHQVCREWRRSRLRDRSRIEQLARSTAVSETRVGVGQPGQADEQIETLRVGLSVLPARELLALHAFYLQEQNVDEARVVLGLSRPGFYRLLSRARGRLRRVLSKQEIVQ